MGPSQQAVGESGSDVALAEVAVFGMAGCVVLLAPCAFVRSPWSVSYPVGPSAGAAVAGLCASFTVPIVGESVAVEPRAEPECEPVDEPMGLVQGLVCSGSTESCVGPSELGFPLVSESVVVIHDCADVAEQMVVF